MDIIVQAGISVAGIIISILLGNWQAASIVFAVCILLIMLVSVVSRCQRERELARLTSYLMKVQDSMELPAFSACKEGQFGILQSEIYKLVVLLKEQSEQSKRQNTYLADMLSDISHQMKTPLTSITIMTELL